MNLKRKKLQKLVGKRLPTPPPLLAPAAVPSSIAPVFAPYGVSSRVQMRQRAREAKGNKSVSLRPHAGPASGAGKPPPGRSQDGGRLCLHPIPGDALAEPPGACPALLAIKLRAWGGKGEKGRQKERKGGQKERRGGAKRKAGGKCGQANRSLTKGRGEQTPLGFFSSGLTSKCRFPKRPANPSLGSPSLSFSQNGEGWKAPLKIL